MSTSFFAGFIYTRNNKNVTNHLRSVSRLWREQTELKSNLRPERAHSR